MSWKNLGLPVQSLIFGAAVAFAAWLLSPYFPSSHYSSAPRNAVDAERGARNHSGGEPYDVPAPRPGSRSDYDAGRGLPGNGR
jgi:hypothetical protein